LRIFVWSDASINWKDLSILAIHLVNALPNMNLFVLLKESPLITNVSWSAPTKSRDSTENVSLSCMTATADVQEPLPLSADKTTRPTETNAMLLASEYLSNLTVSVMEIPKTQPRKNQLVELKALKQLKHCVTDAQDKSKSLQSALKTEPLMKTSANANVKMAESAPNTLTVLVPTETCSKTVALIVKTTLLSQFVETTSEHMKTFVIWSATELPSTKTGTVTPLLQELLLPLI
jgi:hypothetical protein